MVQHIALLGDSVFDNGAYTGGLPDVVTHLRELLPAGTRATLLARDGATTAQLEGQVDRIPRDVDRVVVSVGGNDALMNAEVLDLPVRSTADAVRLFAERLSAFEERYRRAVASVHRRLPETAVCTIYNANFPGDEGVLVRVGLALFNDVILRVAFERRLTVIDLRLVCADAADYANAIEPSSRGAAKIAAAITVALGINGERAAASSVYGAARS